jgi:hypothetical protein
MKKNIKLIKTIGDFAENKDAAKLLRAEQIMPSLKKGDDVILDFKNVNGATQSFIHALISEPIRVFGNVAFEKLLYKNANDDIQTIISIVYRYMQESMDQSGED